MRVLHVDTAREWRGGQTQLLHLARSMADCAVALPPDAPLRPALEQAGVRVLPVAFRGPFRGGRALAAAVRTFRADLVAAHTSHAHGHAVAVGTRPVVVHRRLDFAPGWGSRAKYRRATRFVAVSAAVGAVLERSGVEPGRIDVVLDGVDPRPLLDAPTDRTGVRLELGLRDDAPLLVAAGALVAHKGHRHAVDALWELPGWHLAIAGEGPLRGALLRQARRIGVADRLHLLGQRNDLPRLLKAADRFVHPSSEEGMGQVVAEALIAGSAVVACRVGGVPEVVGAHGVLVDPRSGSALARGVLEAPRPSTPAVHADRFSIERMVEETVRAYRRVHVG